MCVSGGTVGRGIVVVVVGLIVSVVVESSATCLPYCAARDQASSLRICSHLRRRRQHRPHRLRSPKDSAAPHSLLPAPPPLPSHRFRRALII